MNDDHGIYVGAETQLLDVLQKYSFLGVQLELGGQEDEGFVRQHYVTPELYWD